jgi:hypothetical protein
MPMHRPRHRSSETLPLASGDIEASVCGTFGPAPRTCRKFDDTVTVSGTVNACWCQSMSKLSSPDETSARLVVAALVQSPSPLDLLMRDNT